MLSKMHLRNKLIFLIPVPFMVNFFLNLYQNEFEIKFLNLNNLILSFLAFVFLFNFCSLIAQSLDFKNISLCICIFYLSFYVVNFTTLILDKYLQTFDNYFFLTIFTWILFFIYKFKELKKLNILISSLSLPALYLVRDKVYNSSYKISQFSSDTDYFWTPMAKAIHDNSLFFALENNIISGYGLLINYIHAINFKLFISEEFFYFHTLTTNLLLFLTILFIWEIDAPKLIKISGLTIFLSILLNSDWLSYLFINSSMGEGLVSYLFTCVFLNLIQLSKKSESILNSSKLNLVVFFAGYLYFTKPFASYLILFIIFVLFLKNKNIVFLFFGFIGFFINYLNYSFVILETTTDGYLNLSEFANTENLLNLNFYNIFQILLNLYTLDKVISLFLFILTALILFNVFRLKHLDFLISIILTNTLLVFLLYISVWQNKELESAYRYLLSLFNLYFLIYIDQMKKLIYR